jgi:integrase
MNPNWEITPEKFLNREELTRLLLRAEEIKTIGVARKRPQLIRDWMILRIFIFSGLRRTEVAELHCGDFKIFGGNSHLVVRKGKGGKTRHVHLAKGFASDVRWYLKWKVERGEIQSPEDYFLRSERSPKYAPSGLYKRWKKYVPNHRLHDARHTAATVLYEATNNLRLVQKTLGHSSLTVTQVYADISPEHSIAGMNAMERLLGSLGRSKATSVAASISPA